MNDIITTTGTVSIEAAAGDKPAKISILAYAGGEMSPPGFGPTVLELSGIELGAEVVLLADHANVVNAVVGRGVPTKDNGSLLVNGTVTTATPAGQMVLALAKDGVTLGASVGIEVTKRERITAGTKFTANGKTFTASDRGLTLVRGGVLREVSLTPIPADRNIVRRILTNATYTGTFEYGKSADGKYNHLKGGEIVEGPCRKREHDPHHLSIEGTHEAIVDREQFDRCQRMLGERQKDTSPGKVNCYALSGLCRCGCCGQRMTGWTQNARTTPRPWYLCSSFLYGGKAVCNRNPVREDALLACVVAKIEEKYLAPANLDRIRAALRKRLSDKSPKADTAKALSKRLAELDRKIDEGAGRMLAAPADLTDVLADKLRTWKAERDEVQRQLDAARSRPRETPQTVEATIDRCINRLRGLRENLHAVDREQLRTALREIVAEIELEFRSVSYGTRTKGELVGGTIRLRADNLSELYTGVLSSVR